MVCRLSGSRQYSAINKEEAVSADGAPLLHNGRRGKEKAGPFAPYLQEAFSELRETKGIMEPGPGEIPPSKNFLKFAK